MASESSFAEETANELLKELQTWWEIPSTAQYISLFRESFHLPEIEIEDLEKGFIEDTINGPSKWLQDLIYAFLRSILPGRMTTENWEVQLKKLITRKWPADKENPFKDDRAFHELNIRSKVEIIYSLCLYRLDRNDIPEVMKSMDADALRVQKLGSDETGNTYWYFYGTRLYKEEAVEEKISWNEEWNKQKKKTFKKRVRGRPRKVVINSERECDDFDDTCKKNDGYMNVNEKSRWSVVCDTIEEWVNFAEKFKDSKSKNEKALFQIIQENFLPTLNKIYEEKEKKLQQKIRELMPVREKIITRRETRRMKGEVVELPINGYEISDEAHKVHMIKDRARRLEERNKRASEAEIFHDSPRKRMKKEVPSPGSQSAIGDESRATLLQRSSGSNMDIQYQVERLLSSVKLHKDAWPFLYAVNEEDAPAYYDIIKEPIDLSLIESRLFEGSYETIGDLDADFDRMVSNCELYNGEYHAYSDMARTLRKMFRKGLSKMLDSLPPGEMKDESEESRDSNYQSSLSSSSPSHEASSMSLKRHKKPGEKKKKKRIMDALELLAHASDLAVQDNFTKRASPPQKMSPPVQQIQTSHHHVPLTNMPYLPASTCTSNISKISLPVTSSNFMPVNSVMQGAKKEKPLFIRTNVPNVEKQITSVANATSFNTVSSTNTNTLPQSNFQALCTQSLPVVFSGYNQSPVQSGLKNNPTVTMQSNVGVPNGVPIVQKVLIPQQFQIPNNGQIVFASPQNTVRLISKDQNVQVQNDVRQINQTFGKVVPQIVTPTSLMPGLQLQTVTANNAQTFTQVSSNPQFVSIPTFMLSNQNTIHATQQSSPPSVMNLQSFQLAQRQMHLNGPGNT